MRLLKMVPPLVDVHSCAVWDTANHNSTTHSVLSRFWRTQSFSSSQIWSKISMIFHVFWPSYFIIAAAHVSIMICTPDVSCAWGQNETGAGPGVGDRRRQTTVLWRMRRMSGTDKCRDHSSLLRTMSLIYAESCEILFPLSIVVLWSRLVRRVACLPGQNQANCWFLLCVD